MYTRFRHQDSSTDSYSMLYCVQSPAKGAETLFAKCSELYKRLKPDEQEFARTAVANRSNKRTAGGPAAFDAHFGLRMSPTGCRRIRPAQQRRVGWKLNKSTRPLVGVDKKTGDYLFWGAAKGFDSFVGMEDQEEESQLKMEKIMHSAFFQDNPIEMGELDDDLRTISATKFPEGVVLPIKWKSGMAVIWNNALFLHSTTPTSIYSNGERKMYQIIMMKKSNTPFY